MEEYKKLRIDALKPLKWYKAAWNYPAQYIATTGLSYTEHSPIVLLVYHYIGGYRLRVDVSQNSFSVHPVRDIKLEEEEDVKQAIKRNKTEVAKSVFLFAFPRIL